MTEERGRVARRRREAAAQRWRPEIVDLLLVDEAPPSSLDRYFYFEDVATQDSLFRYVAAGVLGVRPTRDKAPLLAELRDAGVFLVDACPEPFDDRRMALAGCAPDLLARIEELSPRRVVLIGAAVYDVLFPRLRAAGVPVVDVRLPYPGSGQQLRFAEAFAEVQRRHRDLSAASVPTTPPSTIMTKPVMRSRCRPQERLDSS